MPLIERSIVSKKALLSGALAALLVVPIASSASSAFAAEPSATPVEQTNPSALNAESARKAADFVVDTWVKAPDTFKDAGAVADAILALASAGLTEAKYSDAVSGMVAKLKELAPGYIRKDGVVNVAGLAKVVMTLDAAGQDPRTFLSEDLVALLVAETAKGGSATTDFWAPYLITIALGRVGETVPQPIIDAMVANQKDGAFGYTYQGTFSASPDDTALGLQAMHFVSTSAKSTTEQKATAKAAIDAAVKWANDPANQVKDSAGNSYWTAWVPANSTGMLASALATVGQPNESAQAFLRSQQAKTGAGAWSDKLDDNTANIMATTQAIFGVTGRGYATAKLASGVPWGEGGADVWVLTSDGAWHYDSSKGSQKKDFVFEKGAKSDVTMLKQYDWFGSDRMDLFERTSKGDLTLRVDGVGAPSTIGYHWNGITDIVLLGGKASGEQPLLVGRHMNGNLYGYRWVNNRLYGTGVVGRRWNSMSAMFSVGNTIGDSHSDVLAINKVNNTLYAFAGKGDGKVAEATKIGGGWGGFQAFTPGRVDADSRSDLAGLRSDGTLWFYANNGQGFQAAQQFGGGFDASQVRLIG